MDFEYMMIERIKKRLVMPAMETIYQVPVTGQAFDIPLLGEVMSNNPRDTQFLGFAQAVVDEMVSRYSSESWGYDEACLLIARRAYDIVTHAIDKMDHTLLYEDFDTPEMIVHSVPDLPELPEEEKQ